MGRELESRLAKAGILKMSLDDMLRVAIENGDTIAETLIRQLISNEEKIQKRNASVAASVAARNTAAAPMRKTQTRSAAMG